MCYKGDLLLPKCPFHGHISHVRDVHPVKSKGFSLMLQDRFFLRCLFTMTPVFGCCDFVKCLSGSDENECKKLEEMY